MQNGVDGQMHRLRTLRLEAALTQVELADRAGLNAATVVALEAGTRGARPPTVRKLATALGIAPRELVHLHALAGEVQPPTAEPGQARARGVRVRRATRGRDDASPGSPA